ncbi:hypothetical protein [Paenibacillus alvei]|uniref:hypothetical protein n=1 Tax=Paenibacillus alvei TaxID=44250 RepID=UPI003B21501F
MDWISGTRAAKLDKTYGSRYGLEGIARTFLSYCCRAAVICLMSFLDCQVLCSGRSLSALSIMCCSPWSPTVSEQDGEIGCRCRY